MDTVRWGILGCGDVTEVKSGPALQKAEGSTLVAVMRRDLDKARDYARRHGVKRAYGQAEDLIFDSHVDAVYVATPPSSHLPLALKVAEAGKPCLVEKPFAMNHGECLQIIDAYATRELPVFVAYYRRAFERFLKLREWISKGLLGELTSVQIEYSEPLASGETLNNWRFDPAISGGGLFMDLGSHGLDLLDFLAGPISDVHGFASITSGAYPAQDVVTACFKFNSGVTGTGIWNFNAGRTLDRITFTGSRGFLTTPVFADTPVQIDSVERTGYFDFKNPPHVHQPLVQGIVDQLLHRGSCESTGESAARTARVMDHVQGISVSAHQQGARN